jgi:hypothetical protein
MGASVGRKTAKYEILMKKLNSNPLARALHLSEGNSDNK